jgi:hypothetical protein
MSRKLQFMQAELEAHQLVTVLVPSKRHDRREWDQVRVNVDVPPAWYRKLCNLHASKRGVRRAKFDTIIRRQHTLSALNRLLSGRAKGTIYELRILEIAKGIKI